LTAIPAAMMTMIKPAMIGNMRPFGFTLVAGALVIGAVGVCSRFGAEARAGGILSVVFTPSVLTCVIGSVSRLALAIISLAGDLAEPPGGAGTAMVGRSPATLMFPVSACARSSAKMRAF